MSDIPQILYIHTYMTLTSFSSDRLVSRFFAQPPGGKLVWINETGNIIEVPKLQNLSVDLLNTPCRS